MKSRNSQRLHRKNRIRVKIKGAAERPRLCVFRSSGVIYAQVINDEKGTTIVSADSRKSKAKKFDQEVAKKVGTEIAKAAVAKKITNVVFDRGGYKYHGKVKALAEAARENGLKF